VPIFMFRPNTGILSKHDSEGYNDIADDNDNGQGDEGDLQDDGDDTHTIDPTTKTKTFPQIERFHLNRESYNCLLSDRGGYRRRYHCVGGV
jgi:hypothetical protein